MTAMEERMTAFFGMEAEIKVMDQYDRHLVFFPDNGWAVVYTHGSKEFRMLARKYKRYFGMCDHKDSGDLWLFKRSGELVAVAREKLEEDDLISEARDFYEKVINHLV